jgi:hypothetical protein
MNLASVTGLVTTSFDRPLRISALRNACWRRPPRDVALAQLMALPDERERLLAVRVVHARVLGSSA